MESLHSDILENLTEYDLEDIVDALFRLHDPLTLIEFMSQRAWQPPCLTQSAFSDI